MNKKELLKLIEKEENQKVEFKESLKVLNEIGETTSAFANSNSGINLVGISELGKIIGVSVGKNTIEDLANYIKRNTDPQIYPSIKIEKLEGKEIILIEVLESREKPVFFKRHAYKRVGKTNLELSSSEIRKLAKETGEKVYWDEQICSEAALEDIDEEKIKEFVKEAKRQRGLDLSETLPIKEILMRLKLLKENKPTNAAVLLFAKNPQNFFLQAEVKCIRFKGIDVTGDMIDFKTIEDDTISQLKKAEDFIFEHIPKRAWIEEGKLQRQEKWLYPQKAIREALANALAHRDYESPSKVQVRIFDDRIEFWNPGKLPEGWTVEKLKTEHESKPFNPLIAKQLFWIKYIEDVGSGTNKIIKWCVDWGLPEPDFEFTGSSIIVTFRISKLTEEFLEKMGLNERQKKAVEYIKERGKITNKEYQEINNVSKPTATRELKGLVDKKIFVKYGGTGKGTYYTLFERAHKGLIKGSKGK